MEIYRLQDTIWCLTKSARFDYLPINSSLCFQLKFCRSRWRRAESDDGKSRHFVHSEEDAPRVNNKVNWILNKSEKGFLPLLTPDVLITRRFIWRAKRCLTQRWRWDDILADFSHFYFFLEIITWFNTWMVACVSVTETMDRDGVRKCGRMKI